MSPHASLLARADASGIALDRSARADAELAAAVDRALTAAGPERRQPALARVVRLIAKAFAGDCGLYLLLEPEPGLTSVAHYHGDAHAADEREAFVVKAPACPDVPLDAGAALSPGRAAAGRRQIAARRAERQSLLALPLLAGPELLGILTLSRDPGRPGYDHADRAAAQELARDVALVLQREGWLE